MQLFAQQPTSREPGVGQRFCPPGSHPIDGYACELNIQPEGTKMEMCLTYEKGDRLNPDPKAAIPCSSRWATLGNRDDCEIGCIESSSSAPAKQQPACPQGFHREGSDPACVAVNTSLPPTEHGISGSLAVAQEATHRTYSPELMRMARVYIRLGFKDPQIKMWACGPEDSGLEICQGDTPLNLAQAWSVRDRKWLVFTKRAIHDLQSDDEVACIMAHEAGHLFSPNQVPYTELKNKSFDERDADLFAIPAVMLAGYDARACPIALEHVVEPGNLRNEKINFWLGAIFEKGVDQERDAKYAGGGHGYTMNRQAMWKQETKELCSTIPSNRGEKAERIRNSPACVALNSGEGKP